ncbi:hypothetical protein IKR55_04945 [bacterium]|nr:hypothetical protein [bacterium]
MAKLGDLISSLKIDGISYNGTFKNPEWWSAAHKLKKEIKSRGIIQDVAKTARFNTSYKVVTLEGQPPVDQFVRGMQSQLDWKQYEILAPWNPVFNKSKTIIVFTDKPKTL